jgi:hypothetical protein
MMNNPIRTLSTLFLLLGCGSGDYIPGPADAFVGIWNSNEAVTTYSGENGGSNWTATGPVTISRLNPSAVVVDNSIVDQGPCALQYDVTSEVIANLHGVQFCEMDKNLGMNEVKEVAFKSGTLTKNGDVLSLTADGSINKLTYSVSVHETSTLTLAD